MDSILKAEIINSLGTFAKRIKSLKTTLALSITIIILKGTYYLVYIH